MPKLSSREGLLAREEEITRILRILLAQKLNFVVIGGYAIATFRHRFSVDLDLTMNKKVSKEVGAVLEKEDFSEAYAKEIELLYGEEFKRFSKLVTGLKIYVDLFVGGVASRTTDAAWSFDYILHRSRKRSLAGISFFVPEPELLAAMKIHSGRIADVRDFVALVEKCNFEKLKKHMLRGNLHKLKETLRREIKVLEKPQFDDSFKGIFGTHVYKRELVEKAKKVLEKLKRKLSV